MCHVRRKVHRLILVIENRSTETFPAVSMDFITKHRVNLPELFLPLWDHVSSKDRPPPKKKNTEEAGNLEAISSYNFSKPC